MKPSHLLILLWSACCWPGAARAQLAIATNARSQSVFPGAARGISVVFHNPNKHSFESEIRTRIFQASSATVILLSERPWKKLQVLPGQTVVESTPFGFPAVKAETKFILQWLEGANRVIGQVEVLVYPTNLLEELRPLAGDAPVGLFDPQNQIKPLLHNLKLDFMDLEISDVTSYSGKLAIFGPFQSKTEMREGLAKQIQFLAKKNTAIVWIQPPPEKRDKLQPSFYPVLEYGTGVVVVQPDLAANLAEDPQAQLNLIYFCRLALTPHPFAPFDLSWNQ
jgi:hypothetical protein